MPWKTIGYIVIALLIVLFIAFNLSNTSDVSFIFFTVKDVPVFFTIFLSMIIGCLIMLPVSMYMNSEKRKQKKEDELSIDDLLKEEDEKKPTKKKRKRKKKDIYGESEEVSDLDIR